MGVLFAVIVLAFYFLPTAVAFHRGAEPRIAILLLNIFLGWTLLVWIALLVWAFLAPQRA